MVIAQNTVLLGFGNLIETNTTRGAVGLFTVSPTKWLILPFVVRESVRTGSVPSDGPRNTVKPDVGSNLSL